MLSNRYILRKNSNIKGVKKILSLHKLTLKILNFLKIPSVRCKNLNGML